MTSRYLSTTSLALIFGLGIAGPLSAQPETAPFCAIDPQERSFPCKGTNSMVVQNDDELMGEGGGVPLASQIAQDAAGQSVPDAAAQAQADTEPQSEPGKKANRKAERKAERQAEREAQQQADKQAQDDAAGQQAEQADARQEADKQAQDQAREEKAKREAEEQAQEKTRKKAEERAAQQEADEKARVRAEEQAAQQEVDRKARERAEEQAAQQETDKKARERADEQAQEKARKKAERKAQNDADEQSRQQAAQQQELDAEKQAKQEADRAARRAERRAARQSQASEAAAEDAEVEQETVSESDVRTSDEDFDTDVAATGQAAAVQPDKKGMSTFEKALLLGLGAAVVGTILKNGDEVVSNSGDRVVVRRDGELTVLKDDDALLRRPGSEVGTQSFSDGSTRTTVANSDGSRVVTIRDADGTVLRRSRILADGQEYLLFDDTRPAKPVSVADLPDPVARNSFAASTGNDDALRRALNAELRSSAGRDFSLEQIRSIRAVRELAAEIEVEAITFATGSAAISPAQARQLADLGTAIRESIIKRPDTVFLVEGHTDAVGDDTYNLSLSDRRAETVALALTEYFSVPPENMITQGYGERYLKIRTERAEPANRRAVVRNITPLLR